MGAAILVIALATVCGLKLVRVLSHSASGSYAMSDVWGARNFLHQQLGFTSPHGAKHPRYISRIPNVYPYSVVPGGIKDPNSLREIAARDRAVARHYSNFDFKNARLERIHEPREVYVSYRIRDTIFWTRKRIRLAAGELLLTDGKITARAKCGNQISDEAKPEVSDEEPAEDVLDQPVAMEEPFAPPPFPMRPSVEQSLPIGIPAPNTWSGGFGFPYVPIAAGPPITICVDKHGKIDPKCGKSHKPPVIPEPGTLVLLGTGLVVVAWKYRARFA